MLVPDLSYSRSSLILKQLEEVLAPAKVHLIVSNTKASAATGDGAVKLLASGLVDGLGGPIFLCRLPTDCPLHSTGFSYGFY